MQFFWKHLHSNKGDENVSKLIWIVIAFVIGALLLSTMSVAFRTDGTGTISGWLNSSLENWFGEADGRDGSVSGGAGGSGLPGGGNPDEGEDGENNNIDAASLENVVLKYDTDNSMLTTNTEIGGSGGVYTATFSSPRMALGTAYVTDATVSTNGNSLDGIDLLTNEAIVIEIDDIGDSTIESFFKAETYVLKATSTSGDNVYIGVDDDGNIIVPLTGDPSNGTYVVFDTANTTADLGNIVLTWDESNNRLTSNLGDGNTKNYTSYFENLTEGHKYPVEGLLATYKNGADASGDSILDEYATAEEGVSPFSTKTMMLKTDNGQTIGVNESGDILITGVSEPAQTYTVYSMNTNTGFEDVQGTAPDGTMIEKRGEGYYAILKWDAESNSYVGPTNNQIEIKSGKYYLTMYRFSNEITSFNNAEQQCTPEERLSAVHAASGYQTSYPTVDTTKNIIMMGVGATGYNINGNLAHFTSGYNGYNYCYIFIVEVTGEYYGEYHTSFFGSPAELTLGDYRYIPMSGNYYRVTPIDKTKTSYSSPYSVVNGFRVADVQYYGCSNLMTTPYLPTSVTIMQSAFSNCTNLTTVTNIPVAVTDLYLAFYKCSNLRNCPELPNGVNTLYLYGTFMETGITAMPTIPNTVKDMTDAFRSCPNLVDVTPIPASVTNVQRTFMECTSLKVAPIFNNSAEGMHETFYGCTSLHTVQNFPSGIKSLNQTFTNCPELLSIPRIPSTVTILERTFINSKKLSGDIYIESSMLDYANSFTNVQNDLRIHVPANSATASTFRDTYSHAAYGGRITIVEDL